MCFLITEGWAEYGSKAHLISHFHFWLALLLIYSMWVHHCTDVESLSTVTYSHTQSDDNRFAMDTLPPLQPSQLLPQQ